MEEVRTGRDSVGLISPIGIPGNFDAIRAHPTLSRKVLTVSKHGYICCEVSRSEVKFSAARLVKLVPKELINAVWALRPKISMKPDTNLQMPAIEFRNVCLSFDDHPVLRDISFMLERGEMIVLTGISGSGKSVLLRLAMGLLKPDSGQIFVEGREIENLNESELLAIRGGLMGMVFQEDSLFTGLPVFENAAYRLDEHGWSEDEIDRAVKEVLRFVGLDGEEEKFPEELSGGMKRRLEIARALIGWPRIMLFDEPTMSLDPLAALKVLDLIIRARDINHISSLYVTKKIHEIHYLSNFRAVSETNGEVKTIQASPTTPPKTRVIVLKDGSIVFNGSAKQFTDSELPAIKELAALDGHDHSKDPYFSDPWDKHRRPAEAIL